MTIWTLNKPMISIGPCLRPYPHKYGVSDTATRWSLNYAKALRALVWEWDRSGELQHPVATCQQLTVDVMCQMSYGHHTAADSP